MNKSIELALRDSIALENCKTEAELHYVVRNIEARHAVEGIDRHDLAAWENVKREHVKRIYRMVAA
jgi:hypothetical protein